MLKEDLPILLVLAKAAGAGRKMNKLLQNFHGPNGRQHLIDALISQSLVGDKDLAAEIAPQLKLEEAPTGRKLIEQGDADTDLLLILEGAVSIVVNGRAVARKKAGEHVGEMAVVDPLTPRSASVIAATDSVVARIAERDFSAIADRYPVLWRRIALELASLLRNGNAERERTGRAA